MYCPNIKYSILHGSFPNWLDIYIASKYSPALNFRGDEKLGGQQRRR
jgi:hypothetical protein